MRAESPLRAERDADVVHVGEHAVAIAYDPDAELWHVTASSVPGLSAAAESREELLAALPGLVRQAALP